MDTITIFNEHRESQDEHLSKFTTYLPFTGDQTLDTVKFAFANPARYVMSLDAPKHMELLSYEELWEVTGQRIARFRIALNVTEFSRHRKELIEFQKWVLLNDIDGIQFVIDYSVQSIFDGVAVISPMIEMMVNWRKQTEQLVQVCVPMIISTYHDKSAERISIQDQRRFDSVIVNLIDNYTQKLTQ